MQASPRSHYNHALEYSIERANELKKPLLTYFGVTNDFPEANGRHYYFLLQGLRDTQVSFADRIKLVIKICSPPDGVIELAENASMLITDRGYLKIQREWVEKVSMNVKCPLVQVETNIIVPVETASPKDEYSAATFRRKINKILDDFLVPLKMENLQKTSLDMNVDSVSLGNLDGFLNNIGAESSVKMVKTFTGGTNNALKLLYEYFKNKLDKFEERNDPTADYTSHMSPYLHFGQISPLYLALEAMKTNSSKARAFLEELIIRRELAMNFIYYNSDFDSLTCLPEWAQKTLNFHQKDKEEYIYTFEEFENAKTS